MLSQAGKHDKVIELLEGSLGVSLLNDAIPGERIHILDIWVGVFIIIMTLCKYAC